MDSGLSPRPTLPCRTLPTWRAPACSSHYTSLAPTPSNLISRSGITQSFSPCVTLPYYTPFPLRCHKLPHTPEGPLLVLHTAPRSLRRPATSSPAWESGSAAETKQKTSITTRTTGWCARGQQQQKKIQAYGSCLAKKSS